MDGPRLRTIVLTDDQFTRATEQAGGWRALGPWIGRQIGVPDLSVAVVNPDGVQWRVVVRSETFAVHSGCCPPPLPIELTL